MRVLIFEKDLFWSARIRRTLAGLGHESAMADPADAGPFEADCAILNLASDTAQLESLVPMLKSSGIYVIGHAGHKEIELRKKGKSLGCDRIASNSELTFKLESLLAEAAGASV